MAVEIDKVERSWGREKRRSRVVVTEDPVVLHEFRSSFLSRYKYRMEVNHVPDAAVLTVSTKEISPEGYETTIIHRSISTDSSNAPRLLVAFIEPTLMPWRDTSYELPSRK